MQSHVNVRIGWGCLLLVGGLLFCGCATTSRLAKPLGDYSAATTDANTMIGATLVSVGTLDQKVQSTPWFIESNNLTELRESAFSPFLRPDDLLQRELAAQALCTYAAKLKELAGINGSDAINKSANSAGAAINSIVTNINQLGTGSANAIPTGVVSGLASLAGNLVNIYAAAERDKALRQVLEENNQIISNICNLLADELDPANAGFIYKHVEHDYRLLEENADKRFKQATANEKPAVVTEYLDNLRKKNYTLALMRNLAVLYRQIAETHSAILAQSQGGQKPDTALARLSDDLALARFYSSQISTK